MSLIPSTQSEVEDELKTQTTEINSNSHNSAYLDNLTQRRIDLKQGNVHLRDLMQEMRDSMEHQQVLIHQIRSLTPQQIATQNTDMPTHQPVLKPSTHRSLRSGTPPPPPYMLAPGNIPPPPSSPALPQEFTPTPISEHDRFEFMNRLPYFENSTPPPPPPPPTPVPPKHQAPSAPVNDQDSTLRRALSAEHPLSRHRRRHRLRINESSGQMSTVVVENKVSEVETPRRSFRSMIENIGHQKSRSDSMILNPLTIGTESNDQRPYSWRLSNTSRPHTHTRSSISNNHSAHRNGSNSSSGRHRHHHKNTPHTQRTSAVREVHGNSNSSSNSHRRHSQHRHSHSSRTRTPYVRSRGQSGLSYRASVLNRNASANNGVPSLIRANETENPVEAPSRRRHHVPRAERRLRQSFSLPSPSNSVKHIMNAPRTRQRRLDTIVVPEIDSPRSLSLSLPSSAHDAVDGGSLRLSYSGGELRPEETSHRRTRVKRRRNTHRRRVRSVDNVSPISPPISTHLSRPVSSASREQMMGYVDRLLQRQSEVRSNIVQRRTSTERRRIRRYSQELVDRVEQVQDLPQSVLYLQNSSSSSSDVDDTQFHSREEDRRNQFLELRRQRENWMLSYEPRNNTSGRNEDSERRRQRFRRHSVRDRTSREILRDLHEQSEFARQFHARNEQIHEQLSNLARRRRRSDSLGLLRLQDMLRRDHRTTHRDAASMVSSDIFPTREYKESATEDTERKSCSICLETFKNGDVLKTLPCFHYFHAKEIDQWLKSNRKCPLCRHPIDECEFNSKTNETPGNNESNSRPWNVPPVHILDIDFDTDSNSEPPILSHEDVQYTRPSFEHLLPQHHRRSNSFSLGSRFFESSDSM